MKAFVAAALLALPPSGGGIAPPLARALARGPAEMLVVLKDQADLAPARALATRAEKGRFVVGALRAAARAQAPLAAWLAARGLPHRGFLSVNAVWTKGDASLAAALAARGDVLRLEANPLVRGVPPEPPGGRAARARAAVTAPTDAVRQVNAPAVWATGFHGEGIVVADADTGVLFTHQALQTHYRGWSAGGTVHDGSWHDAIHANGGVCGNDSPVPCDAFGLGTRTAGLLVGDDGLGNQIGAAPGARWIACRNMDGGGKGSPASYVECMDFFLAPYPVGGTTSQGDPSLAPDVVNNSWVCPPSEGCADVTTLETALAAQQAAGILTVSSAGNDGSVTCGTIADPPATSPFSLTVGALQTGTRAIASFSSVGPVTADGSGRLKPDLVAPGTGVPSSCLPGPDTICSGDGTSFASPLTAGVAALLLSARPELRHQPLRARAILTASAAPIAAIWCGTGPVPNATYGFGLVDALEAIHLAGPLSFFSVTPCRLVDTRLAGAGGPLAPNSARPITVAGSCGVPADARAVVLNVTAVYPASAGDLRLDRADYPMPAGSVLACTPGRVRAAMGLVALDPSGGLAVWFVTDAAATGGTDLLLDVSGYYR